MFYFTFTHVYHDGSTVEQTVRLKDRVEADTLAETVVAWDRRVSSVTVEQTGVDPL